MWPPWKQGAHAGAPLQKKSPSRFRGGSVLPGFGLSLGFTLLYLALMILIPLSTVFLKTASLTWSAFWETVTGARALAAYRLSLGAAFLAASINAVFGLLVAWVLERYRFPGRRLVDAFVDLPFALPTAVAGIALATLYAKNGWIGRWLDPLGLEVAYTPLGVVVALTFIGLPFVVRTVQPVLADLDPEVEEAAASLGATRWQTFRRVLFPELVPAAPDRRRLLRGMDMAVERQGALTEPRWVRGLLLGVALAFLCFFLFIPLALVFFKALEKGFESYLAAITEPVALEAVRLTLTAAAIAVPVNLLFGLAAAWAIAKFRFRGKNLLITLIDLPFSVSPVISGMIFVLLFGAQGFVGPWLAEHDVKIIFAVPGIVLATMFVTAPMVARELIPLMQSQGNDEEEVALTLGASGFQTFFRVSLPKIRWGLLYGVVLCNARAMGEFGAVSVVSGHIRGVTNTMPLHVEILYNEYQFAAAFAVASLLALLALVTLAIKSLIESGGRRGRGLVRRSTRSVLPNQRGAVREGQAGEAFTDKIHFPPEGFPMRPQPPVEDSLGLLFNGEPILLSPFTKEPFRLSVDLQGESVDHRGLRTSRDDCIGARGVPAAVLLPELGLRRRSLNLRQLALDLQPPSLSFRRLALTVEPRPLGVEPQPLRIDSQRLRVGSQRLRVYSQQIRAYSQRISVNSPRRGVISPQIRVDSQRIRAYFPQIRVYSQRIKVKSQRLRVESQRLRRGAQRPDLRRQPLSRGRLAPY